MKSPMRQAFEELHGFEVGDEMDIQTSVAWDNWKTAWRAAASHERETCAKVCESQTTESECHERAQYCADAIRTRSNA